MENKAPCPILILHAPNVLPLSRSRNASRNTTGNETLRIPNDANPAGILVAPILAAQEEQGENVNDSRSRATSAAKLIPSLSSLRVDDRYFAVSVSVRIGRKIVDLLTGFAFQDYFDLKTTSRFHSDPVADKSEGAHALKERP